MLIAYLLTNRNEKAGHYLDLITGIEIVNGIGMVCNAHEHFKTINKIVSYVLVIDLRQDRAK